MRLFLLPFLFLISCTYKQEKVEQQRGDVQSKVVDSSSKFKSEILGKWYFPGSPDLVMEIKGGSVEYMDGFLEVRYSIMNNKFLLLFNPDETVDTVETKIVSDTLYQREVGVESFTRYTRQP